ncbi:hypothetical protein CHH91_14105 [Virgibacillus sp. 7505]|uniref:hypothetical protein n=1 Tax=Virgibacillus sp. 7505 TaxID=2022548 RepID=UPI000BA585D5|nr:hypothetical protein [Virgibacillus sp. 7505]PAE15392.1 hypothetical protein CHH91_14105 [Virgibacillus sp. 7505]
MQNKFSFNQSQSKSFGQYQQRPAGNVPEWFEQQKQETQNKQTASPSPAEGTAVDVGKMLRQLNANKVKQARRGGRAHDFELQLQ